jgi:hypothetical protein
VELIYPGIGGQPIIVVAVKCGLTNRGYFVNMLLDTGAEQTCFPAAFAKAFGHDNTHPDVVVHKNAVQGIGGFSDSFIHSLQISLLDPVKSRERKPVIAWSSPLTQAPFVEKLDCLHGLIGMDVMRGWKGVGFEPNKHGVKIRITI